MAKLIHTDHNGVQVFALDSGEKDHVEFHNYDIYVPFSGTTAVEHHFISFQNGPIKEVGTNGITNEALLALLIHRLGGLNSKFPCRENSIVITKLEESLMWLEKRTKDRLARGVEGQNKA